MSGLFDHAATVMFLLGFVALAFGLGWWYTRLGKYLVAAGGMLLLILLLWLLSLFVVTDRQQIRRNLEAMAQGVLDGKPDAVFKHLAKDFAFEQIGREEFVQRATREIQGRRVKDLHLWDFDFEEFSASQGKAKVAFRARVDLSEGPMAMVLVRANFVREGQAWTMKAFQVFNAVANTDRPLQIPWR